MQDQRVPLVSHAHVPLKINQLGSFFLNLKNLQPSYFKQNVLEGGDGAEGCHVAQGGPPVDQHDVLGALALLPQVLGLERQTVLHPVRSRPKRFFCMSELINFGVHG